MTMKKLLLPLLVAIVGCSAEPMEDEASTSEAALEEQWSLSTPTVFAIEKPMDLTFTGPEDWSDLEVQDPLDPNHAWRPAGTVARPDVTDRPRLGSSIRDQLGHGLGSGPCRPRLNPFKREIGFMCKWTF